MKKNIFLASLKSLMKGDRSGVGFGSGSIRGTGTDPQIRIRTKMSRIPNTGCAYVYIQKSSVVENLGVLRKAIGLFDPKTQRHVFALFFLLMDFKTVGAYFSFIHWQQL
jgi:hypothetical protein